MAFILIIFGVSIGIATFIENDFGTDAARSVVYNATWFEILLIAGMINIIAVTISKRMYQRSKLTLLIFHLAFVVIILGAGITRFFGTEGTMYIREGATENSFLTARRYLGIMLKNGNDSLSYLKPVLFSDIARNRFRKSFKVNGHSVRVELKNFMEKAGQSLKPDPDGGPHIHLVSAGAGSREDLILEPGGRVNLGKTSIRFLTEAESRTSLDHADLFISGPGNLSFIAPFPVVRMMMSAGITDTLAAGEIHPLLPMSLHYFNGNPLVLKEFLPQSTVTIVPLTTKDEGIPSALDMEVTVDGDRRSMTVFGMADDTGTPVTENIEGTGVTIRYGSIFKKLPFAVHLNDFILKRYPGSGSPSWFESSVRLIDLQNGIDRPQRIYMNNILNYKGYRLYQASYDRDEHGSLLAVNHDGAGTKITYLGYLCLAIGFVLSLLNRKSRFAWLWRSASDKGRVTRAVLTLLLLVSLSPGLFSQDKPFSSDSGNPHPEFTKSMDMPVINPALAREFDTVLVQDNGGRIEPMNTLASEILRKVVRKEKYEGQTPQQVLLGMMAFPQFWLHEPMIMVNHPGLQQKLRISGKYASFVDFFDEEGNYIFRDDVEGAYRKKPAYRSKFDNEVIRADERLNVCNMIYTQSALKIFPLPGDSTNTWYSPAASQGVFVSDDSIFVRHALDYLLLEIQQPGRDPAGVPPVELVRSIKKYQQAHGSGIIPSKTHIRAEIFYNNSNLFVLLMRIYMLTGFILLFIQFIHIFLPRFNIRIFSIPAFVILLAAFLVHMAALGLRWYIAGHAPWSNGFEALTFIAWATMLSGLIFSGKSSITLSATAILASLILMVAHLSWMDPQITSLVPVLKSYWLVIHVADITASYGFLGLGALLAAVNLLLMLFQTKKNSSRIEPQVTQISRIIEMTLTIGLYMLVLGTFLGGVWANESWGRYWGWDPKETWALTTAIVYAVILHVRLIPGLRSRILFNILALAGFGSVVMTYFGVNYYLSGLHSYAKGDPMPIPPVIYYSVISVLLLCSFAAYNQARLRRRMEDKPGAG